MKTVPFLYHAAVFGLFAVFLAVLIREDYPVRVKRLFLQETTPVTETEHYRTMRHVHARMMQQVSATQPMQIAFVGDSIIESWLTEGPFPSSLNLGIGRDTVAGVLNRIDRDMIRKVPAWYLAIGINDILRDRPPDTVQKDLERLIQRFSEADMLILRAVLPVEGPNWTAQKESHRRAVNDWARQTCSTLPKCHFLPAPRGYADNLQGWTVDGLHPNALGYQALTRQLTEFLHAKRA